MSEAEDLRGIANAQLPALTDLQLIMIALVVIMMQEGIEDDMLQKELDRRARPAM